MKNQHDKDRQFLDRHADELDELLREATAAISSDKSASSSATRKKKDDNDASTQEATEENTNKKKEIGFNPNSLVAFSTYSTSSVKAVDHNNTHHLSFSNPNNINNNGSLQLSTSREFRTVRLKPIDNDNDKSTTGANPSTSKSLKNAQKAERQWYKENVLIPQRKAQKAEKKKQLQAEQEKLLEEQARLQREENTRSIDPTRYWMLKAMKGSLAPESRFGHSVVAFDDQLYVFGGSVKTSSSSSSTPTIPTDDFFVASNLASAYGIQWSPVIVSQSTRSMSITKDSVSTATATKPLPRSLHSMTVIPQRPDTDAVLFLFGGVGARGNNNFLGDTWFFHLQTNTWEEIKADHHKATQSPPSARCGHSCSVLKKRYAFIFGGRCNKKNDPTATKVSSDLFVFDSSTRSWLKMTEKNQQQQQQQGEERDKQKTNANDDDDENKDEVSWPCARYSHASASDPASSSTHQERLFIHGGIDNKGRTLSDLWIFDYSTRLWREVKGLDQIGAVPRSRHGLVALSMNQVLMFGGVSIIDSHHQTHVNQLFSSSPAVVVNICEDEPDEDQESNDKQANLIVETVRSIPFVGNSRDIPQIDFHSFGGIAESNGTAYVFSGVSKDRGLTGENDNFSASNSASVGRFSLPLPRDIPLYDQKTLFSQWAAKRFSRETTPVPHDIELCFSSSTPSTSLWCHKSILEMRAPSLLQVLKTECHQQQQSNNNNSNTKYTIAPRRRGEGISDPPLGFCENKNNCVGELLHFIYKGVFSETESRRLASLSVNDDAIDVYLSIAKRFDLASLSRYVNILVSGNSTSSTSTTTVSVPTKKAFAERFGVTSVIDDTFASLNGYTCPGDVNIVVEDAFSSTAAKEKIQVHSSIVACASPVLRAVLARGEVELDQTSSALNSASSTGVQHQKNVGATSTTLRFSKPERTITGLKLPTGSALSAVVEHMYDARGGSYSENEKKKQQQQQQFLPTTSTNNRLVHIGNAFEVSFIAARLNLPFLRSTAERVVLDSLAPILEHPIQGLCSNLSLAKRYDCGRVCDVVMTAISMRIYEVTRELFGQEIPLECQPAILETARECFPQGLDEIVELEKEFNEKSRVKYDMLYGSGVKSGVTIAKSANEYEDRALMANLRT